MRYFFRKGLATALLFLSGCCAKISGTLPPPQQLSQQQHIEVGAAKIDITPVPGIAMGGYSIVGTTGRGYWTRLYARTLYFRDTDGHSFALVSCDLWSVSGGLADRVAELVAQQGKKLAREQIILAATHTHHSPGNFSTSPMYNEFASYRKGFDSNLFHFFAQRIAQSIVKAMDSSTPATIAFSQQKIPKLVRNRSVDAFLLNVDRDEILHENAQLPIEKKLDFPQEAYQAVDAELSLIHCRKLATGKTIAAAGFFAVHPTVMGAKTEVYHADLFGIAARMAEEHLQRKDNPPIVALFNGAEGDISPNWEKRDRRNTMLLGKKLAQGLIQLLDQPPKNTANTDIKYHFEDINLAKRCFQLKDIERCTAEKPSVGVATLGGATDGRSRLHSFLWREHVKGTRDEEQGTKQAPNNPLRMELPFLARFVLDSLMGQIVPPKNCPLGVYQLGDITFVTMPGEFTTTLGRRIRQTIAKEIPGDVVTIGLANEYISYFTTPEEYEVQHYEGASTLYGPFSGTFIEKELQRIAKNIHATPQRTMAKSYSYHPGPQRKFHLQDIGSEPYLLDSGLGNLVQDLENGKPIRDYPQFTWNDILPPWPAKPQESVTPYVKIQAQKNGVWQNFSVDGVEENDRGVNFVTILLKSSDKDCKWGVIWMPSKRITTDLPLRFCVKKLKGEQIYSDVFHWK